MGRIRGLYWFLFAAVLGLTVAGAIPASASVHGKPDAATAACQTDPACVEPVVAISQVSSLDLTPADDAALSVFPAGATSIYTRPNNGVDNGTQDWQYVLIGHVPHPGHGPGQYGFTGFDRANYGGDGLYQLEWMPFAQDSGLCLNIGRNSHLASLQGCGSGKGQAFIVTDVAPGINAAAGGYQYAISVRQAATLQRHDFLTADDSGFGQVSVQRGISHSVGAASDQMWFAVP
jgi:hypothetical protein